MIILRKSEDRGHAHYGWLATYHTFSFGDYDDPRYRGYHSLRVLNEDTIQPGKGFEAHPHKDMEIITLVLEGGLEHADSAGNKGIITSGDVQRMSAGTGIIHSEKNASKTQPVHLLQIWIHPRTPGGKPSYEQKKILRKPGAFTLLASPDGKNGSVTINQDVNLIHRISPAEQTVTYIPPIRWAYLHLIRGKLLINKKSLTAGDGAAIEQEKSLDIASFTSSEYIIFEIH